MTVISVENVSKAYRLGQIGGGTLKADVARWWAMLRGQPDPNLKIGEEHLARKMGDQFWALDDVSFEVKEGEVLGIIGRNGAGKSTLLKILSQVTTPTSGQIKIKGRIASLLEVGTGFHPELTGRENVFLNGAILGMTKAEIRKKFDEIVAFSGVEEFIDTPVKRYSSGMYVRLAFAVAAHLESEILICDEVLAVGDAEFQKKCLGKMKDVSQHQGRTVMIVSHNMPSIKQLCRRCVLFKDGRVSMQGPTTEAIDRYLDVGGDLSEYRCEPKSDGKPKIMFARLDFNQSDGAVWLEIPITIWSAAPATCSIELIVTDRSGTPVGIAAAGLLEPEQMVKLLSGENCFQCRVDLPKLAQGDYNLFIQIAQPWVEIYDKIEGRFGFKIVRQELGSDRRHMEQNWGYGSIELPLQVKRS